MRDQTQPWAEQTVEVPPQENFRRGRASVAPRASVEPHSEAYGPDERSHGAGPVRPPGGHNLRRGGGWTVLGGLFAFVCWGIWAISARGDLTSPVVTFVLSLGVAAGLFVLSRLVGRVVLERQLGRVRRSARGAHLVTGVFLLGLGVAYLQQTAWVVSAWSWLSSIW